MTGFDSKRQMAADKVLDLDGHVVGKVRKPKREWVGLNEDDIRKLYGKDLNYRDGDYMRYAKSIEAKLKEKNT